MLAIQSVFQACQCKQNGLAVKLLLPILIKYTIAIKLVFYYYLLLSLFPRQHQLSDTSAKISNLLS